jgi:hypothetical protein
MLSDPPARCAWQVRRLFELQGSFSDLLVSKKASSQLQKDTLQDAAPSKGKGAEAAAVEKDAVDELAANFADIIEKAVDNQCRQNRGLGLPTGASGAAGALEPHSGPLTFEVLFGPRLIAFGPDRAMLSTADALPMAAPTPTGAPPTVAGGTPPVLVLFGHSTSSATLTLAMRLSALAQPAGARVVFVSLDGTKVDYDRFTAQRLPNCFAVPFRVRERYGERARKLLHTESVSALVVTRWAPPEASATIGGGGPCVEVLNEDAASEALSDELGVRFPWVRRSVEELMGDVLVRADGTSVHRDGALQGCDVLAIYFGGARCGYCNEFLPHMVEAYHALKARRFETLYVECPTKGASQTSEATFDRYVRSMPWLVVPYARHDVRRALPLIFRVESVPEVRLFRRDPLQGGRFVLKHRGRDAMKLLTSQLAAYPWQLVLPLTQSNVMHELPGSAALVVLCEHLSPTGYESQQLHGALEQLAHAWQARKEVATERKWPMLKFIVASGPPTALSRRVRTEARLPPASAAPETLQLLLIDQRWPRPECARYLLRAVCEHEAIPYSLEELMSSGGKRLMAVLEVFFGAIQPEADTPTHCPDSIYHKPPIREQWTFGT